MAVVIPCFFNGNDKFSHEFLQSCKMPWTTFAKNPSKLSIANNNGRKILQTKIPSYNDVMDQ